MRLEPLRQWQCDTCKHLIENPSDGVVEYRHMFDVFAPDNHADIQIVHDRRLNDGLCQRAAALHRDIPLDELSAERGLLRMLGVQSTDSSWAETVRRVLVPHYEEGRRWFKEARAEGWEVIETKITPDKLVAIIETYASRPSRPAPSPHSPQP